MDQDNELFEIKPYSTKELSLIYGVSDRTLGKWLLPFKAEIGKRTGRYYTIVQVEIILKRIGMPPYTVRA
jgi:hypothetical protein